MRPTLRCLRDDLRLEIPSVHVPLDQLDHPLLHKAAGQFADRATHHERIRSIDDLVLFKVKVGRWRGAAYCDDSQEALVHDWLVAAGIREEGSVDDFYEALGKRCRSARKLRNRTCHRPTAAHTSAADLLPNADDVDRYLLEAGGRWLATLGGVVRKLIVCSLRSGHEYTAELDGFRLGVMVRAEQGHETYVAVRITGSVRRDLIATILQWVPGCEADGWFPEYQLPRRELEPAEQAWSNMMDPKAAAALLEREG